MEINDSMEFHECFGDYLSIFHNTECTMHTHYVPYTPPVYWTMPFTQRNREVGCYSEHLCLKQLILSKGTQPALFLLVCPPSFHMCLFSALKLFVSAQYLWLSFYLELKGFLCSETSYHILVWLRMWAEVSQRPACPLSSCDSPERCIWSQQCCLINDSICLEWLNLLLATPRVSPAWIMEVLCMQVPPGCVPALVWWHLLNKNIVMSLYNLHQNYNSSSLDRGVW